MSRELLKYEIITKYSSLWQDTIRNGEFVLTNTNRLVRFLDGCNGLKTGSTDKAGYCISATAKRGDMQLIAVVMSADSITERNNAARALLEYGFSNYALFSSPAKTLEEVPVRYGAKEFVSISSLGFSAIVAKGDIAKVEAKYELPEFVSAPVSEGEELGFISFHLNGEEIGRCSVVAEAGVGRITFWGIFFNIVKNIFS